MSEKRMFSDKIIGCDAFTDMPQSTQLLYIQMVMGADDDGFNNHSKIAMVKAGATADDLQMLIDKKYIIKFPSGVYCIKHWKMQNAIRQDRKVPTAYTEELEQLTVKKNGAYSLTKPTCQPNDNQMATKCQPSIVEDSIDKDSISSCNVPSREEVQAYVNLHQLQMDAKEFYRYYNNRHWTTKDNTPVINWKNLCSAWAKREIKKPKPRDNERHYSEEFFNSLYSNNN